MLSSIILFLSVLCLSPPFCSCAEIAPVGEAYRQADVVVAGKVTAVQVVGPNGKLVVANDNNRQWTTRITVSLQVSDNYKGAEQHQSAESGTVVVRTYRTEAMCGVRFQQGKTYLVYARTRGGDLWTSSCTPTKPMAAAQEDIEKLRYLRDQQ